MASPVTVARATVPHCSVWPKSHRRAKPQFECTTCELRTAGSLCGLSDTALLALQRIKLTAAYPAGTMIYVQGQPARGLYILCKGRVKLQTTNSDGRTLILKIAQQGEGLGLDSVLTGRPYEMTAEVLQPSQIAFVARDDFMKFMAKHGDACLHFARHLGQECYSAYSLVRSIGLSQSVADRMAKFLLDWSSDGTVSDGLLRVKLALTHQEIAQLIGTSRETVSRILGDFRKRGFIEVNGSTMLLRNKPALEAMVA